MARQTQHVWYYMKSGLLNEEQEGPFSEQSFIELARLGKVSAKTKVSSPTRTKNVWRHASDLPALMIHVSEGKVAALKAKTERSDENALIRQKQKADKAQIKKEKQLAAIKQKKQVQQAPVVMPAREVASVQQPVVPQILQQPASPMAQQNITNVVIANQHRQSNTIPVLVNFFLWPGLGQLCQGRVLAGIFIMGTWVVSVILCFFLIGLFIVPFVWLLALIDAAMYRG